MSTPSTITVYGIPGCTTVKKSTDWLSAEGVAFERVHVTAVEDLPGQIRRWIAHAGLLRVLNTRATTFKALPREDQQRLVADEEAAIRAMAADPRLIKRPLLDTGSAVVTGFDADAWSAAVL